MYFDSDIIQEYIRDSLDIDILTDLSHLQNIFHQTMSIYQKILNIINEIITINAQIRIYILESTYKYRNNGCVCSKNSPDNTIFHYYL